MNAKGLLNVETLTFSKSDPYCRVKVSGEEIGKTNVVENSLDPTWEKDCYSVMFSSADLLDFDLFDYQNLGKDRSLGSAPSLKLQDFISDVDIINFLQDIDPTVVIDPAFDGDRRNSANNLNNSKLASEVMARLEKDGFKIVHTSRLSTDVWCPIYLKKLDVVSSADAGSNLSSSTSKESKQKGHLHFKLSYLPVVPSKVLKYERSKGDSTRTSQILAPAPSNGANSGGGTVKEDAQVSPSLTPPVAELPKSALITLDWVASVFKQYPSGILQILVHEGRGMSRHGNMYAQVICDSAAVSEAPFKSSVLKNTLDPVWNESAFVFIRDITDDSVTIVVKVESGEKNKPDHIIGVYRCNGLALANLIGKQNEWVNLTDPEETKTSTRMSDGGFGRLRVTMSYFPVAVEQSARASISKDSKYNISAELFLLSFFVRLQFHNSFFVCSLGKGSLQLDLLEAVDLEAVDQGGASDPYCVVSLGLDKLHKTKVHKKTLNPVFNESLSIPIKSLLSTKINIEVVDYK